MLDRTQKKVQAKRRATADRKLHLAHRVSRDCRIRDDCVDRRTLVGELAPGDMDILMRPENVMAEFEGLSDHFILRMYEFIRDEVRADVSFGTRLVGQPARDRAERLLGEINRRGLYCRPIEWPASEREMTDDAKPPLAP